MYFRLYKAKTIAYLFILLSFTFNTISKAQQLVKDIAEGNENMFSYTGISFGNNFLFFEGNYLKIYLTDGITGTTTNITPSNYLFSGITDIKESNGKVYFVADGILNESNNYTYYGRELFVTDGTASGTKLVKDMTLGSDNSNIGTITTFGSLTLFRYYNSTTTKYELWRTDGVEANTFKINNDVDLTPNEIESNGRYYFVANDIVNGKELWITDGTLAGTQLLKDIYTGATNGNISHFVTLNNSVFFTANNGTNGYEVWKTDATIAGTTILKDINAGSGWGVLNEIINYNGLLYFAANNGTNGTELWRSDGTSTGTQLFKEFTAGSSSSNIDKFYKGLNKLFFTVNGNITVTDGTLPNTIQISNATNVSLLNWAKQVGNTLTFWGQNTATGKELWKTDGTSANTTILKDIKPGAANSFFSLYYFSENPSRVVSNTLFFEVFDEATNEFDTWQTDGSSINTVLLQDLSNTFSKPRVFGADLNNLYFIARDNVHGREVWRTNGTTNGTYFVQDTETKVKNSDPTKFVSLNNYTFFWANGYVWRTDGTTNGTIKLNDLFPNFQVPQYLNDVYINIIVYKKMLYVIVGGKQVWRTDGIATMELFQNSPLQGSTLTIPKLLIFQDNLIYGFEADNAGFELWKTDGTQNGTVRFTDIRTNGSSFIEEMTVFNDKLFFTSYDNNFDAELYSSDGTLSGTLLFKNINTTGSSYPRYFFSTKNKLYFAANDGTHGEELWVSDGTANGTILTKDIATGSNSAVLYPKNMALMNDIMYFQAIQNSSDWELWRSDGTNTGTYRVKDIWQGLNGAAPSYLVNFYGKLIFSAQEYSNNTELWVSDGSQNGTQLFKDLNQTIGQYGYPNGSYPSNISIQNGYIFFTATDNNSTCCENIPQYLYISDGTPNGTNKVSNLPVMTDVNDKLTYHYNNGKLFFTGIDATNGKELWSYDFCPISKTIEGITEFEINRNITVTNYLSSNYALKEATKIDYSAGKSIVLLPGFSTDTKTVFNARIATCPNNN